MSNKKYLMLIILLVIGVIVVTSSTTFAYLSISKVQSEANTISTTCYDMTFTDSNRINITGYPMSSTSAFTKLTPYKFTLKNNCEANTEYQVILNVINTSSSKIIPYIDYSLDGSTVKKISSLTPITLPLGVTSSNASASYLLETGTLEGINTTKNFNLHMWIDESAGNDIMGSKFEGEITIYSVAR